MSLYSLLHSQRIETCTKEVTDFATYVAFIAYCIRRGLKHRQQTSSTTTHRRLYSLLHSQRIET